MRCVQIDDRFAILRGRLREHVTVAFEDVGDKRLERSFVQFE
jgi:hypothetical protein